MGKGPLCTDAGGDGAGRKGPLGKSALGRGEGECKGPGDGVLGLFKESRGARVTGKE